MQSIRARIASRVPAGMLWRFAAAVALFLFWRICGMPSPGVAGRLIPLAWLLSGVADPHNRPGRIETACALVAAVSAFFWTSSGAMLAIAMTAMVAGVFPAMLRSASRGGRGVALAILPLAPLIVFGVPFTGDEPFNAALSESIILDGDLDISDNLRQLDRWASVEPEPGAPALGITHQQPLFPLLISPGILLGIPGFRIPSLMICVLAAWLISRCATGAGGDRAAGGWALLLLPGAACVGLAYADWAAACLVAAGVLGACGRRPVLATALVAILLALLKIRFAPAGLGLLLAALFRHPRLGPGRVVLLLAVTITTCLLLDRFVLGGRIFWVRYGNQEFLSILWFRTVSGWKDMLSFPVDALIDQEAGLLWRAPWLALAVPGIPALFRRHSPAALPLVLSGSFYLAAVLLWMPVDWHSMPTPTGRFFIPLLPLAAVAASMSRPVKPLICASIAASALYAVMPGLRFNYLDGRDSVFDAFGRELPRNLSLVLPSMVRPDLMVAAAWLLVWVVVLVLLYRNRNRTALAVAAVSMAFAVTASRTLDGVYEAEDLGPDHRVGCSLYPLSTDPQDRLGWTGSRERLLRLGSNGDAVMIPVEAGAGSASVEIVMRGIRDDETVPSIDVAYGGWSRTISLESAAQPLPDWITRVKRGAPVPPPSPGTVRDSTFILSIPDEGAGGLLVISSDADLDPGSGIFLDRIKISRSS